MLDKGSIYLSPRKPPLNLPRWFNGKESTYQVGDLSPIPGRSLGEGNDNPLQYACLENLMDRGAGRATSHGVTKSQT